METPSISTIGNGHSPSSTVGDTLLARGEIRLLSILGTGNDIELRTARHRISEGLDFDAIPYIWGASEATTILICNDVPISVTPLVFEMLVHMRLYRPYPDRPLWIDVICIDQQNKEEKAIQIPLMHKVYSQAATVIVWLGTSSLDTIEFVSHASEILSELEFRQSTSDPNEDPNQRGLNHLPLDSAIVQGMFQILDAPWFGRLWTFQEAALAAEAVIMCGETWLGLDIFLDLVVLIYGRPHHAMLESARFACHQCHALMLFRAERKNSMRPSDVPDLLHEVRLRYRPRRNRSSLGGICAFSTRHTSATVQLDRLQRRCRQSWRTLVDCMKVVLRKSQDLRILDIPFSMDRDPALPSWCPDFRGKANCAKVLSDKWNRDEDEKNDSFWLFFAEDRHERAVQRQIAAEDHDGKQIFVGPTNDLLKARGFVIDRIAEAVEDVTLLGDPEVYSAEDEAEQIREDKSIARSYWIMCSLDLAARICEVDESQAGIPQDFLTAFWADHRINDQAREAYLDAITYLQDKSKSDTYNSSRYSRMHACLRRLKKLEGHSFFSTRVGRFGLATPGCKSSDYVCVIYGGEPLYILRPHDGNGESVMEHKIRYGSSLVQRMSHM